MRFRKDFNDNGTTLIDEIFREVYSPKYQLCFEIDFTGPQTEMEYEAMTRNIAADLARCLRNIKVSGIDVQAPIKVTDKEVVLELSEFEIAQITQNRVDGIAFMNKIGQELVKKCGRFYNISIEGKPGANRLMPAVRGKTLPRYVDIVMTDKPNARYPARPLQRINIEVKRGCSHYKRSQREKDNQIARDGMGPTFLVRGNIRKKRA